MNAIFGPVPSKRLGRSLGIDITPFKTCNWNCVYCQLGYTAPLCNVRRPYLPVQQILAQLDERLAGCSASDLDWITFVGSGEPTLHSQLGLMIKEVKKRTTVPVAVLTNGALLYRPEIRQELLQADAVLPSLDAADKKLYLRINRPWPELTLERLIDGLFAFRRQYPGQLWIEVMLLSGMNDNESALIDLAALLKTIGPDEIHVNTPTRPPAEAWVLPPPADKLKHAQELFGSSARFIQDRNQRVNITSKSQLDDAILDIITRHPMQVDELTKLMPDQSSTAILSTLQNMQANEQARRIYRFGKCFWSNAMARYHG